MASIADATSIAYPLLNGIMPTHAELTVTPIILPPGTTSGPATGAIVSGVVAAAQAATGAALPTTNSVYSVEYDDNVEARHQYANARMPVGDTSGRYVCRSSWTLYRTAYDAMVTLLLSKLTTGGLSGFGDIYFNLQMRYTLQAGVAAVVPGAVITDTLLLCRLVSGRQRSSEGTQDAIMVESDLHPYAIAWNGKLRATDAVSSILIQKFLS